MLKRNGESGMEYQTGNVTLKDGSVVQDVVFMIHTSKVSAGTQRARFHLVQMTCKASNSLTNAGNGSGERPMTPNSRLLSDAFRAMLRTSHRAAKPER